MKIEKFSIKGNSAINEDWVEILHSNEDVVVSVSDGMGGLDCGDIASRIVSKSVVEYINHFRRSEKNEYLLFKAMQYADERLAEEMEKRRVQMGAVTLAAIISPTHLCFCWQGNVRLYIEYKGICNLLSKDHVLDTGYGELRLTRCIKGQGLRPSLPFGQRALDKGYRVYICTDGLYAQNAALLSTSSDIQNIQDKVVETEDDATLVMVEID